MEKPKSQPQEQIKTNSDKEISKTPTVPKKIEKPNSQPKSNTKSPFFSWMNHDLLVNKV